MSTQRNSVHASLTDNDSVVCIRNCEFTPSGCDVGGNVYVNTECLEWLIDSLRSHLNDGQSQRKAFTDDDLEVTFAGPDYQPLVAIYSRRNAQATHGGKTVETMTEELAGDLVGQLEAVQNQLKP